MSNKIKNISNGVKKDSIIRTIYLYIFALLGLALIIMGSVRFLDMGLKVYVFTKADQEMRYDYRAPAPKTEGEGDTVECLELISNEDYITSRRHRDASINLALILVGLPLYLYHWGIIKRESKEKVKNLAATE